MNDQRHQPSRQHHFYVSIAKFLFHHPQHGIVAVRDPIRLADAKQRGLDPIVLYGITVAGLPIRWLTFSPADRRRSLREVLLTAWRGAEGLRGAPDVLRVNRYVAQADPLLAYDLAKVGVHLEVADARDKTVPASLRSAHDASRWLWRWHDPVDSSLAAAVDALCLDAQEDHNRTAHRGPRGSGNRKLEVAIAQWLDLPMCGPSPVSLGELDWEAGSWLSSWETSLPPEQSRYFHHDGISRRTWLLRGETASADTDDDDDEFVAYEEHDNTPAVARNLIACWPNSAKDIAATAGITLRQLQWFTSGRATLDQPNRYCLRHVLGIEYDDRMAGYRPAGPYVLVLRKAQAIEAIYQEISRGGNACACELVPAKGQADPSWRYVLINAYSTPPTIVMAPRGEAITERLPDLMMNYEGVRSVSQAFYRDVVATCARACLTPQANVREMTEFAGRYEQRWANCAWLPD